LGYATNPGDPLDYLDKVHLGCKIGLIPEEETSKGWAEKMSKEEKKRHRKMRRRDIKRREDMSKIELQQGSSNRPESIGSSYTEKEIDMH
jgi:hypothetical protein